MHKISSDLLDRIKTAVIKKLREMDRYVDNELPDYIMILVANKRTISHMQKDLSLFLGKHTAEFTIWLFEMVANLKKNSSAVIASSKSEKAKEKIVDEDADVLDYDLGDQEVDLLDPDENSSSSKPGEDQKKTEEIAKKKEASNRQSSAQKSAKVYPVQPVSRLPVDPDVESEKKPSYLDEYDPTKPEVTSGVSSVVRTMKKSHSKTPTMQTNKLLLRAVNDATKSIIDKSINRYKPTPIKMLASTKSENLGSRPQNLVPIPFNPASDFDLRPLLNASESSRQDPFERDQLKSVYESDNFYPLDDKSIDRVLHSLPDPLQTPEELKYDYPDAGDSSSPQLPDYTDDVTMDLEEEEQANPHFIVTLDGVALPSLKRKFLDSEDETMDYEDSFIEEEDTSPKRLKVGTERCKYWPSCKNSNECSYHHPTIPCKNFPDCKYGDKCLYVHPNCKFDARCSRKGCPYTHVSKKSFPFPKVVTKRPPVARGFKVVCKFYPKCTVKNCAFIHPKLCHFGTKCRLPTCPFTHVSVPPRNQLKWKANASEEV